jgi:hypothetical protein
MDLRVPPTSRSSRSSYCCYSERSVCRSWAVRLAPRCVSSRRASVDLQNGRTWRLVSQRLTSPAQMELTRCRRIVARVRSGNCTFKLPLALGTGGAWFAGQQCHPGMDDARSRLNRVTAMRSTECTSGSSPPGPNQQCPDSPDTAASARAYGINPDRTSGVASGAPPAISESGRRRSDARSRLFSIRRAGSIAEDKRKRLRHAICTRIP